MSLKNKITLVSSSFLLLVVLLLSVYTYKSTNLIIEKAERKNQNLLVQSLDMAMEEDLRVAEIGVKEIVNNKEVQRMFAERDREALKDYLLPIYEQVSETLPQGQFHLPDSTSFLRLNNPEKYGDSLKDFRFTVNQANEDRKTVMGIEEGVSGFGFMVVTPVTYEGKHLGTFEYGSNFERGFLERLEKKYKGSYYLYSFNEGGEPKLITSMGPEGDLSGEELKSMENLKSGESTFLISKDRTENISLIPFKSYDGEVIGMIKVARDRSDILSQIKVVKRTMTISILLILALSIFISSVFVSKLFKPLGTLIEKSKVFGKGDFTEMMDIKSKDEIGMVADSLNQIAEGLKDMLKGIGNMSDDVASTAEELSASAEEILASTDEVVHNILNVEKASSEQVVILSNSKGGIENMASEISILNEGVKVINTSMDKVMESTEKGIGTSNETRRKMLNLRDSAKHTTEDIDRLNHSSREIENIVDTIQEIASQTNLLALNAAIEAARAGDSGKGFSVVAEEVKKLAEESSESSKKIDILIKEIQKDIKLAVESINKSNSEVEDGVKIVNESNKQFESIRDEVEEVAKQSKDISDLVDTIYSGIDNILHCFENMVNQTNLTHSSAEFVTSASEEQATAVNEITKATIGLAELATNLRDSISQFKY